MPFFLKYKSTVFYLSMCLIACGQGQKKSKNQLPRDTVDLVPSVVVAANRTERYFHRLENKKVGVVANHTSVIFKETGYVHLVDSLLSAGISIQKVFAPEHGFRGKADAGEHVKDGIDAKTGLTILSLHGKSKKPSLEQLQGLDILVFDIQDVGVRFYTYIATLQLVMEACAEARIPILVLDRPNPNAAYVDGPTMKLEHRSFLGFQPIPLVYGMTIGEYASMLNQEGMLDKGVKAMLHVVPLAHYQRNTSYSLPIRPSPNLPNDKAINLYPSLGLFEGTHVNAGRGTSYQFQRYGASFLDSTFLRFSYTPKPNFGSKYPKQEGEMCYGENLVNASKLESVSLKWLLKAYQHCSDKKVFFKTDGFTKHAGTELLQQQIEAGFTEEEIKATWQPDIDAFKEIRKKYLMY